MDWITLAQIVAGFIFLVLIWALFRCLVEGIYYLQFNGWWPIRILVFPITLILVLLGAWAAAATARDFRDWWHEGRSR